MRRLMGFYSNLPSGVFGLALGALGWLGPILAATNVCAAGNLLWRDFLRRKYSNSSDRRQLTVIRMCVTIVACVTVIVTVAAVYQDGRLALVCRSLAGLATFTAPATAVFLTAVLMPCSNNRGALAGLLSGLLAAVFLTTGHAYYNSLSAAFPPRPFGYQPGSHCDQDDAASRLLELLDNDNQTTFFGSILFDAVNNPTNESFSNVTTVFGDDQVLVISYISSFFQMSQLFHPMFVLWLTVLTVFAVSSASGGQDVYSLDWNLMYWTCNGCAEKMSCLGGATSTLGRSRAPFVATDSFRYAHHNTNLFNPKVKQLLESQTKLEASL